MTTPSYKVKRLVYKPREEWAVVENCHEAIIDRYDFESVQRVLTMDGRIETVWNYRDELEKLILDLQGGQQDGETKSLDLLQGRTS